MSISSVRDGRKPTDVFFVAIRCNQFVQLDMVVTVPVGSLEL